MSSGRASRGPGGPAMTSFGKERLLPYGASATAQEKSVWVVPLLK